MEYNKENNPFYEIDYSNKVLFFDSKVDNSLITEDFLQINLTNPNLKKKIFERYNLKKLPCLLYYKNVIELEKEQIEEIEKNKTSYLKKEFDNLVENNDFVLFLKGDIDNPYCGFSKKVVNILSKHGMDLQNVIYYDILMNDEMRENIKKFNRWPTFPQFFVKGEFIGGCDIIVELDQKGELDDYLKI